jgi:hypothetical protein
MIMDVMYQDIAVTGIALSAAFVLIRRVRTLVFPRKSSSCAACPGCEDNRGADVNLRART